MSQQSQAQQNNQMANPRKFSEKIALQKQKQAEGTAEFERIIKEVHATRLGESSQANQKILEYCISNAPTAESNAINANKGGSSGANSGASGGGASPDGTVGNNISGSGSPTAYRESRGRSVGVGPMRRPSERKQDRSPYGSNTNTNTIGMGSSIGGLTNNVQNIAYLSPPMDSSWRRSNSDSALHQSLNIAIANDSAFGVGESSGINDGVSSLHANYQHHQHHHHGQRSHSPNIGRSFSPQAQRRKGNLMQQQQQQFLEHHLQMQHQHQQQQQLQQQHMQMQQQQQQQQQQAGQMSPQVSNYNAKFLNCNNTAISNSLFKPLQDQAMAFANTGSLPDLTSVHYAQQQNPQHHHNHQQHHQQQGQNTLSPIMSPHNNGRDRDKSPSPFSGGGGGGATSPYHQQHHSPTSAANTPTAAQAPSSHLSFTNLSVQSPTPTGQHAGSFGNLKTLGAAGSTGNLTDYRQPLNPPSPGSSPGLLTSASGTELHTSAPASPTRHPQTSMQQGLINYNEKGSIQQTFERYSPSILPGSGNPVGGNSLNPSFHNHFEQFSLGDSSSSPDQPNFHVNSFSALEFDDFVSGGGGAGGNSSSSFTHNLMQTKILDFTDMNVSATAADSPVSNVTTTASRNNNNNNLSQPQGGQSIEQQQQQQRLASNNNNANGSCRSNNNNSVNAGAVQHGDLLHSTSPIPSPSGGCPPSPSSPLPIPISSHHHHHQQHHQQQQQSAQNQHHQLSLSLHSQHSPLHSPMHSPHHGSSSPLSASSPSGTTMGMAPTNIATENSSTHASNVANHTAITQQHQQQQQQQQSHSANTPTTNIPSIIFSDYSSNPDFSREIFDTLDLDLGQIDVAGLQMLSDNNAVMISDPTIEDSFRRDLN